MGGWREGRGKRVDVVRHNVLFATFSNCFSIFIQTGMGLLGRQMKKDVRVVQTIKILLSTFYLQDL